MPSKPTRGIYERVPHSGRWWIRYTDANGKRLRRSIGTRPQAVRAYQAAKRQARAARIVLARDTPQVIHNPELLSSMCTVLLQHTKSVKSWREYERSAYVWKTEFPNFKLSDITPQWLERWRAIQYLRKPPPQPGTLNRHLSFLKRVFNVAIDAGICQDSPFLPCTRWPHGVQLGPERKPRNATTGQQLLWIAERLERIEQLLRRNHAYIQNTPIALYKSIPTI